jgi:hypothetical protein
MLFFTFLKHLNADFTFIQDHHQTKLQDTSPNSSSNVSISQVHTTTMSSNVLGMHELQGHDVHNIFLLLSIAQVEMRGHEHDIANGGTLSPLNPEKFVHPFYVFSYCLETI